VPVPEAPLRSTKYGLVADVDGWFVLNARDSRWRDYGPLGVGCNFEGKRPFRQLGININVLEPGEPLGMYHRENHQENFLVLAGECLLIVEGEERPLKAWDFFHCPGGTAHIIIGAGDGPAVVVASARAAAERGSSTWSMRPRSSTAPGPSRKQRSRQRRMRGFPRRRARSTARVGFPSSSSVFSQCFW
jgi:uncharacterized cupin superfamily protein